MEIKLECPFCRFSKNRKSKEQKKIFLGTNYNILANPDDNISIIQCSSMHASVAYFTNKKFDLLFESGLKAIKDYYFRESVASVSASLERFYQYSIEVLLNDNIYEQLFEKAWKTISNQSERQLGAFIFLYLNEFGELPIALSSDLIGFRNKVIHKGYFPTYEETIEFAEKTLEVIESIHSRLKKEKLKSIEIYDNSFLRNLIFLSKERILDFQNSCNYNKQLNYTFVKRPFSRKIPSFLSNIDTEFPKRTELKNYIANIMIQYVD